MTPEEAVSTLAEIGSMNHETMARLWRFEPMGSKYFQDPVSSAFIRRFEDFGGMTSEISKKIGFPE